MDMAHIYKNTIIPILQTEKTKKKDFPTVRHK